MEITPQTKLFDLLESYPFLEEQIMHIAPPFQNLKNPVLRRTVGKLATLEKVAQIGGLDANKLVNTLRRAVGHAEFDETTTGLSTTLDIPRLEEDPEWIAGEPQFIVDDVALLQQGEVPLSKVNELLGKLETGRFLLLLTNFEPTPMLEALQKQNRKIFHKTHPQPPHQHFTFIG